MSQTFRTIYTQSLVDCVATYPEQYAWSDKSYANVMVVARRMFDALDRGTFNHDSPAFRLTAKRLGIKPTRKALLEAWNAK